MDCSSAELYIKSLSSRGISPGLSRIERLLDELGNPQNSLKIIHIAGTNGKGSVGAYISSILNSASFSTARFVSPCVGDYENTFLFNQNPIDTDILLQCTNILKKAVTNLDEKNIHPTSFEAETALALLIFSKINPDYTILECGMGGKLDSTNVIPTPELAVITKIAMDHTAFLGDTLKEIASEKAGIIKPFSKVVTLMQKADAMSVIESACANLNAKLYIADEAENPIFKPDKTEFFIDGIKYETKMLGKYQIQNAALAIKCCEVLGIPHDITVNGIKAAKWDYRFEKIGKFVLDGAHNPDGAEALSDSIKCCSEDDIAFVCACFKDKDYDSVARITAPLATKVYCVKAPSERGLDENSLAASFKKYGADASPEKSLDEAIKKASCHKKVVVFGTLSILHKAKQIIEREISDAKMQ